MGRQNFNITDKKYNHAINMIIAGESTITAIATEVGIDWKTAKKIYADPDTHELIASNATEKVKNSMEKMSDILLDIAKNSKNDAFKLEAAKHMLALGGMTPTNKQEIKTEVTNAGALGDVLEQLKNHNSPAATDPNNNPSSNAMPDDTEADDD